jgi:hypothetical protein
MMMKLLTLLALFGLELGLVRGQDCGATSRLDVEFDDGGKCSDTAAKVHGELFMYDMMVEAVLAAFPEIDETSLINRGTFVGTMTSNGDDRRELQGRCPPYGGSCSQTYWCCSMCYPS